MADDPIVSNSPDSVNPDYRVAGKQLGVDGPILQAVELHTEAGGVATKVDGANPLPVTGVVVTGGLTDAQLRAAAVPVSGTVVASGPLTDAQLRVAPVPVSGNVTTGGLTDAQLRATAVPVSQATVALTASGPGAVTVGVASAEAVPVNANRKGLVLVNLSDNTISLAFGVPAVLNAGITLLAQGGSWTMTRETFTTQQVRAIASAAGSALAYQEFV